MWPTVFMAAVSGIGPARLGGMVWEPVGARPADMWMDENGGPGGAPAIVARAFPKSSSRWQSNRLRVVAGAAYCFRARIRSRLDEAHAVLWIEFFGEDGKEVGKASSPPIFWHHDWADYAAVGVAPEDAVAARLVLAVFGTQDASAGDVALANPVFGRTVSLDARLDRPGNVIKPLEAATVRLMVSGLVGDERVGVRWQVLDFDHKPVEGAEGALEAVGNGDHTFGLPALPPGYYTLVLRGLGKGLLESVAEVSFAVVEPLSEAPPPDSPICLDAGMSWSYAADPAPDRLETACYLCQFAGIRLLRDRLWWGEVQREAERFEWGRYARAAAAQARHGITVYQIFHDCPRWARVRIEGGVDNPQYPPKDPIHVYRFVNQLVKDLGDKVRFFEVWNEPNIGFFLGYPWDYAAVLKAAYLGAKDADPGFGVLIGSAAGEPGEFYDIVYENGAGDYFDVYNQHWYGAPEALFEFLPRVRRQLERYGLAQRPVWMTEMGKLAHPDKRGRIWPLERQQASYLIRAYACALANGVRRFHYFYLAEFLEASHRLWGILRRDLSPKPAYVALCTLIRQLGRAECLGWRQLSETGYLAVFRRSGNEAVAVAWDGTGGDLELPARGPVLDAVGRLVRAESDTPGIRIKLSDMPLFVRGIALNAVASMGLRSPVPATEYVPRPDPDLPSKHVFLQAEVNPDTPRPKPAKMLRQKTAFPLRPGIRVTVAAWVNNYTDRPVRIRVVCRTDPGLRLEGATEAQLAVPPWGRRRHDFVVVAHQVAVGQKPALRLEMVAPSGRRDKAVVYFAARETDIIPAKRAMLFDPQAGSDLWVLNHSPTVKLELASDREVAREGQPSLRVEATVIGDGDAWAFPRLRLPEDVDLGQFRGLELWSYVAPGEERPLPLHVQLVEENGGTWLIADIRQLSEPGWKRSVVLLSSARPTPWGPDPDGRLDLSRVREILVGWGGYRGRTGEKVRFWLGNVWAVDW